MKLKIKPETKEQQEAQERYPEPERIEKLYNAWFARRERGTVEGSQRKTIALRRGERVVQASGR